MNRCHAQYRLFLVCFTVISTLYCQPVFSQGTMSLGGYVIGRGGWNSSFTALSRGEFGFATLPDFGIEGAYTINSKKDAAVIASIGVGNFAVRSLSYDPFSGRTTNEFIMNVQALCLSGKLGLRFYRLLNLLPECSLFFRSNTPLNMRYDATVDVFNTTTDVAASDGTLRQYTLSPDRLQSFMEIGTEIGIITIPIGDGKLSVYLQGSLAMTQIVKMLPLTRIPDNFNIVGKDPLAGLRTLNVQPVSIGLGVGYAVDIF